MVRIILATLVVLSPIRMEIRFIMKPQLINFRDINEYLELWSHKSQIFFCTIQDEYKIKDVHEDLVKRVKNLNNYLRLLNKCYRCRFKENPARSMPLSVFFNDRDVGENDHILFFIKYENKNQINEIKHLWSDSKYRNRFKIALVIDPCEKDAIDAIKLGLPKQSPNFASFSYD